MKIALLWTTPDEKIKVVLDAFKDAGHEVVYWVAFDENKHLIPNGAIFHNHFDALSALPADSFKNTKFDPPSAGLIKKMYRTESLTLSMMNKHYKDAPVDERRHVYYTMLSYWNRVLDETKPDVVIFGIIPHTIYNFVLHELALEKGIKTVSFEDIWVIHRTLVFRNFWKGSEELQEVIKRTANKPISEKDLSEEMREYWGSLVGKTPYVEQPFIALQRRMGAGLGLLAHRLKVALRTLANGTFFKFVWGFVLRVGKPNLIREYAHHITEVDWDTPFVYFPLHYQPERTTMPQGDMYHDQLLVIETLSASLPDGWKIYVKEHPMQWLISNKERYSSSRYRGYYERIAAIPNVLLAPLSTDSFTLIERSKTVAAITGTAGWEALSKGKCTLLFGMPWYRDCPGVYRIDSVESCKKALGAIKGGAQAAKGDLLRFLKAYDEVSVRAYIEPPLEDKPLIDADENIRILAKYACDFLKKL